MGREESLPQWGRHDQRSSDRVGCSFQVFLGILEGSRIIRQGRGIAVSLSWNPAKNIGGARIHLTEWRESFPPVRGEQFEVAIRTSDRSIRGTAKIAWRKTKRTDGIIPIGISFVSLNWRNQLRLEAVIEREHRRQYEK